MSKSFDQGRWPLSIGLPKSCQAGLILVGSPLAGQRARADPQVILPGSPLPGCQYPFVRDVLRDPRFAANAIPSSSDPAFQLLCTHPDTRAAVQDDPGRWPAAVEEMLRLITPTTFTGVTPGPTPTSTAASAPPGSHACCSWPPRTATPPPSPIPTDSISAAQPTPRLSFSAGAHFCLGAPLARMHGEVALNTLFTPACRTWRSLPRLRSPRAAPPARSTTSPSPGRAEHSFKRQIAQPLPRADNRLNQKASLCQGVPSVLFAACDLRSA